MGLDPEQFRVHVIRPTLKFPNGNRNDATVEAVCAELNQIVGMIERGEEVDHGEVF